MKTHSIVCNYRNLVTTTILLAALFAQSNLTGSAAIMPPNGVYGGKTYPEWGAASWQWGLSYPGAPPYTDGTGALVRRHQRGAVWFLMGANTTAPVTRTARVPDDVALFVTLDGAACDNLEDPPFYGANEEEMRSCALGHVPLPPSFELDGVALPDLESYYFVTPLFDFIAVAGTGVPPGPGQGVGAETTVLIEPLSPGSHTIHFTGGFEVYWDVTYELTVFTRPTLTVRPGNDPNVFELSWPFTSGFILQETNQDAGFTSWVNVAGQPNVVNGVSTTTVANNASSRLFRLLMP